MRHPSRPSVSTIERVTWSCCTYDLGLFALGFESRAVSLLNDSPWQHSTLVALGFDHGHAHAYEANRNEFARAGAQINDALTDAEFESVVRERLSALPADDATRVLVDVSCFTRFRLASIVHEVFMLSSSRSGALTVDFVYSLAEFEQPNFARRPNTVVGPAHPAFAGWSQGGPASTAAVLGLGYEQDQALGVVEHLQAGEVWAFAPESPLTAYRPEVDRANDLLLTELPAKHLINYDVCAPGSLVVTLESVVRGLVSRHSVVLVPFGPKIFVLCSLVLAAIRRDVAVWRVSQGRGIEPHDRRPSGVAIGLRLHFAR